MSKNVLKTENNKLVKIAVLSVKNCDEYYDSFEDAAEVSGRFIRLAALLPKNESLGWQINTDQEGKLNVFAFSDPSVKITKEDYSWIFQEFASVEDVLQDSPEDMCREGRRTYALQYMPKDLEFEKNSDYPMDNVSETCYKDLFKALVDSGAVIRITASAEYCGAGMILISLQDEMPLRMRTILSTVFPNTMAIEVASDDAFDNIEQIPKECIAGIMTGLLVSLMLKHTQQEHTNECDEDFLSPLEEDIEEYPMLIEELELSIRSYNCLKRAGIYTVEELSKITYEDLLHIRNLGKKSIEEIQQKLEKMGYTPLQIHQPAPNYSEMLEELIGLENVKEQVRRITALAKMKKEMAALGKDSIPVVLNMEFVGNPGTAKTSVARIIAGIFNEIGLLSSSDLVEVGRANLVGKYVGHTANNVKNIFSKAKGKLLLIDEAYSLVDSSDFGVEAINTIIQEMENNRDDTIVILAGYPDKMETLFSRNPGLRSRVPFQIDFSDYSTEEMVQIAELEAKRRGFSISLKARKKVISICEVATHHTDMGNGRFCRNLVESAILNYASRVYGNDDANKDKDFVLTDIDFAIPGIFQKTKKDVPIGFRA